MHRHVSGESGNARLVSHRTHALWFRSANIELAILLLRGVHASDPLLAYAAYLSRIARAAICSVAAYIAFADRSACLEPTAHSISGQGQMLQSQL